MIKERYVNFEVAKLLRDKGFEEVCSAYYEDFGTHQHLYIRDRNGAYNIGFKQHDNLEYRFNLPKERYKCACPTQAMACDWLRENYKIHIVLLFMHRKGYVASICDISDLDNLIYMVDTKYYPDIETVYNEALEYILTNFI